MNELIKIRESYGKKVVSGRELHHFLEIETPFHKWMPRMLEYGFIENTDWTKLSTDNVAFNYDIALLVDCAKEISMIQRTERGKIARQYFIECEKQLQQQFAIPKTFSEALMLAAKQAETIELQQKQIELAAPKVEFFDAVTDSTDAIDIGSAAKVLNLGIGRNKLFEFLRKKEILMNNNQPYQSHIDNGHFRTIEQKWQKPDGSTCINIKTVVYQKGLNYIRKLYTAKPN
jgi:anti-repressor protein